MPLENTASISSIVNLNADWPSAGEAFSPHADHQVNIKLGITRTFLDINGEVSTYAAEFNHLTSWVPAFGGFQGQLDQNVSNRAAMSAAINLQVQTLSASLGARVDAMSDSVQASIHALSATLHTTCYTLSATVADTNLWQGSERYVRSDTPPSPATGAIWFQAGGF